MLWVMLVIILGCCCFCRVEGKTTTTTTTSLGVSQGETTATTSLVVAERYMRDSLYLAYNAFCPAEGILAWNTQWTKHTIAMNATTVAYNASHDKTRGYVAYSQSNRTLVVSFRGSNNLDNWILDLEPAKCDWLGVKVHCGFLWGYQAISSQIYEGIDKAMMQCPMCSDVLFTGHSLGAAIAGIALVDFRHRYGTALRTNLCNFGMPRVGGADWVTLYKGCVSGRSIRTVHYHDIVPHFPFFDVLHYRHVTTEHWNRTNTSAVPLTVCSSTNGDDPTCSYSVPLYELSRADHMLYLGVYNTNCA